MKWLILILGILANTSASVLIKFSTVHPHTLPSFQEPLRALANWPFWLGLFFYGVAFVLYAVALLRLPLNVVHPVLTSGAIALVAMSSVLFFKEPFFWSTFVGIVLIIAGVTLITYRVE